MSDQPADVLNPPAVGLDDMLAGIKAKAFRHCGRPAMALVLRVRDPARPWITSPFPVVLVEREDGKALAGTVTATCWDEGKVEYAGIDDRHRLNLMLSWFGGETAWTMAYDAHVDRAFRQCLVKGRARAVTRISGLVADILPQVGFSDIFLESLRCAQPWFATPRETAHFLFGRDKTAANVRDFVRRHPLLSYMKLAAVTFRARRGTVALADVFPRLDPRYAQALGSPVWARTGQAMLQAVAYTPSPDRFLAFVGAMPLEWVRPAGVAHARGFLRAYLLSRTLVLLGADPLTLVGPSRGDWVSFQRRCREAAGKTRLLDKYENPGFESHLLDPLSDFATRVVLPVMAAGGHVPQMETKPDPKVTAEKVALRILYREKSLPGCYEAARRWHDRLASINALMPDEADESLTTWRPLFAETTVQGVLLKPLVTAREIEDEGSKGMDAHGVPGLDHCVASYRARARHATSHIVSLRATEADDRYARLATAELSQDAKGRLKLVQLQGRGNTAPGARAVRAMDAFLKANPRLPVIVPSITVNDDVRELCGYDWRDPGNVRKACLAYATMLPRGLRVDPDSLMASIRSEWNAAHLAYMRIAA